MATKTAASNEIPAPQEGLTREEVKSVSRRQRLRAAVVYEIIRTEAVWLFSPHVGRQSCRRHAALRRTQLRPSEGEDRRAVSNVPASRPLRIVVSYDLQRLSTGSRKERNGLS